MTKVRPSRGWVALEPIPYAQYAGTNLSLPEDMQAIVAPRATVVAIGPQKYTAMGTPIDYNCKVGDVVMYRTGGQLIYGRPYPGEAFILLDDNHVVATVLPEVPES